MNKDFSRSNLINHNFKELDLSGADFSYSDIRGADFSGSNLSNADFSYARLGIDPRVLIMEKLKNRLWSILLVVTGIIVIPFFFVKVLFPLCSYVFSLVNHIGLFILLFIAFSILFVYLGLSILACPMVGLMSLMLDDEIFPLKKVLKDEYSLFDPSMTKFDSTNNVMKSNKEFALRIYRSSTSFRNANLSNVDFFGATIGVTHFYGANLENTKFDSTAYVMSHNWFDFTTKDCRFSLYRDEECNLLILENRH
jgi:hypothetical protein